MLKKGKAKLALKNISVHNFEWTSTSVQFVQSDSIRNNMTCKLTNLTVGANLSTKIPTVRKHSVTI